jgi:hypothetical protein
LIVLNASPEERGSVLRNPTVPGISRRFCRDTRHEMATTASPEFLRSIGAPAAVLGAMEGIADAAKSADMANRPGGVES